MSDEDYNSCWFGCLVLVGPYIIIGSLMLLCYAIRNHAIQNNIFIVYEDKFVDIIKCGQDEPEKSGYKEWKFIIGCHILWFDDIKDFARYYNLQDRLAFPLNRTTEECMENHLIHLHSGRTIEAVGMTDI